MKNKTAGNTQVEFSRIVNMADVSERQPLHKSISAKLGECAALAARFDLISLKNLEADLALNREMAGRMVRVKGRFTVDVEQKCIVTLEAVPAHLKADVEGFFTDVRPPTPILNEFEMPSEPEDPEFVKNGNIDLGELVAQYIALELDPYPRKDDAHHTVTDEDESEREIREKGRTHRPFSILQDVSKDK